jgi:hypothetical protein
MPSGAKGEKHPADVIGHAAKVIRILGGEENETLPADDGRNKAAREAGKAGQGDNTKSPFRGDLVRCHRNSAVSARAWQRDFCVSPR